jgi:histidine triad (HIT) family protein
MNDCIFCQILSGKLPSSIVCQDDRCTALMDIQPVNTGHILVIPNEHAACLIDLNLEMGAHLFRLAHRVAIALQHSGIKCEGVNLFLADGEAAGQEVFHVHLHVFPRFRGDGFGLKFGPRYGARPERVELDASAQQIREAL